MLHLPHRDRDADHADYRQNILRVFPRPSKERPRDNTPGPFRGEAGRRSRDPDDAIHGARAVNAPGWRNRDVDRWRRTNARGLQLRPTGDVGLRAGRGPIGPARLVVLARDLSGRLLCTLLRYEVLVNITW
jgi:hypothetical protein